MEMLSGLCEKFTVTSLKSIFIIATIGLATSAHGQTAGDSNYPNRPIRLIVPFAAGSSSDIAARRLDPYMGKVLGQPIVVENRAGALGVIGAELLKRSVPDGYTLMMTAGFTFQAALRPKTIPYDVIKDFTPIARSFITTNFVVAHPSVPVNNIRELIAHSQALPNGISFATGGTGSTGHMVGELLRLNGGKFVHVPYTAAGQGINDVLGGNVPVMIYTAGLLPHIRSGRLKALAAASVKRHFQAPDISSFGDQGFSDAVIQGWNGYYGPAGLPTSIRERVFASIRGALTDPEVRKSYVAAGLEEGMLNPDEFRAFIEKDLAMLKDLVIRANLPVDEAR